MFRANEYIVCLNTPVNESSFPRNHVFKQRDDCEYLSVYEDIAGDANGWGLVNFDRSEKYSEWRYATVEEIEHYEKIGKPYNVVEVYFKTQNYDYLIPILTKLNIT